MFELRELHILQIQYTLSTCAGRSSVSGRKASDLIVESLDGTFRTELPTVVECNQIPTDRKEIPTSDVIRHFKHLRDVNLPPHDADADITTSHWMRFPRSSPHIRSTYRTERYTICSEATVGWVLVTFVLGRQKHFRKWTSEDLRHVWTQTCRGCETCQKWFRSWCICVRSVDDEKLGNSNETRYFLIQWIPNS